MSDRPITDSAEVVETMLTILSAEARVRLFPTRNQRAELAASITALRLRGMVFTHDTIDLILKSRDEAYDAFCTYPAAWGQMESVLDEIIKSLEPWS